MGQKKEGMKKVSWSNFKPNVKIIVNNLLKKSNVRITSTGEAVAGKYYNSKSFISGTQYTLIFNSNGPIRVYLSQNKLVIDNVSGSGIKVVKFTYDGTALAEQTIQFYNRILSQQVDIYWACLYVGDEIFPMEWLPCWDDIQFKL